MAFEIISLNKFERKFEYEPDYIAEIKLNNQTFKCEIYTNARLKFCGWLPEKLGNSRLSAYGPNLGRLNGNLYLKIESMSPFVRVDDEEIGREFRKFILGRI